MAQQIQISTDEEETIEISAAEYKAVMEFSVAISEQNSTVLESVQALAAAMIAQGENLVATFAALRDTIAGLTITVNVPEQASAAPQITVQIPEQPAPVVNIKPAAEKKKKVNVVVKRDKNGAFAGLDGTIE